MKPDCVIRKMHMFTKEFYRCENQTISEKSIIFKGFDSSNLHQYPDIKLWEYLPRVQLFPVRNKKNERWGWLRQSSSKHKHSGGNCKNILTNWYEQSIYTIDVTFVVTWETIPAGQNTGLSTKIIKEYVPFWMEYRTTKYFYTQGSVLYTSCNVFPISWPFSNIKICRIPQNMCLFEQRCHRWISVSRAIFSCLEDEIATSD